MPKFLIDPFIKHGSFIIISLKPFKQNYVKFSVARPQLPYHLPGGLGLVVVDEIMVRQAIDFPRDINGPTRYM